MKRWHPMFRLKLLLSIFFLLGGSFLFANITSAQSYLVNPNQTYSYAKMVKDIEKLEQTYPDLITVQVIGTSEYGRNLYAVSLGKGNATIFINGSHHAREWITTNINLNMIDKYAHAYETNGTIDGYNAKSILTNTTIWFVPMVNPDGVTLQQTGLKYFPKTDHAELIKMNNGSRNFKRWKANGKGIDLNRQYNARWYTLGGGSSPTFKNFKGTRPESASETKALLTFVKEINPEMAISYHSSGQIIFWKYGQTGSRYTRDRTYVKQLNRMTGYGLISPASYTGGGGFSDWFSTALKKPAYTIEVSPYVGETHVPLSYFKKIWRENEGIGLYTAKEGAKLYDNRQLAKSNTLTTTIKTFNTKAKQLASYYDTSIKKTSQLKITSAQTTLYNQVKKEITKREQEIKKLPTKYQTAAKAALATTKMYRDRYNAYQTVVTTGEQLISTHTQLTNILSSGSLDASTVDAYDDIKKAKSTVKTNIKQMYNAKVRTLATTKYITSIEKETLAIESILARYQVLVDIDKQITEKEYDTAKNLLLTLEQLNEQAVTNDAFEQTEHFLQTWQTTLGQAIPVVEEPETEIIDQTEASEEAAA